MKRFFNWFDLFVLVGNKVELDHLIKKPLCNDETLRLDKDGCFYCLKVPENHANIWNKILFWTAIYFNKKSHLAAIDQAICLFEQRLSTMTSLMYSDFQEISKQIECLKSLKNDYGFTLDQESQTEVDRRLLQIEKQAYILFESSVQQLAFEQERHRKEIFLRFLNESQSILTLLDQESCFGLQEARRILLAYSDDIPHLFEARLHNIQARLLLAQDLNRDIELMDNEHRGKFTIPNIESHLNSIKVKLNHEINSLENEIEMLINNLKYYFIYHPQDITLREYFHLIGINPSEEEKTFDFDAEKPVSEKIEIIQDHLNQLAA